MRNSNFRVNSNMSHQAQASCSTSASNNWSYVPQRNSATNRNVSFVPKTKVCTTWLLNKYNSNLQGCKFGNKCRFSHDENALEISPEISDFEKVLNSGDRDYLQLVFEEMYHILSRNMELVREISESNNRKFFVREFAPIPSEFMKILSSWYFLKTSKLEGDFDLSSPEMTNFALILYQRSRRCKKDKECHSCLIQEIKQICCFGVNCNSGVHIDVVYEDGTSKMVSFKNIIGESIEYEENIERQRLTMLSDYFNPIHQFNPNIIRSTIVQNIPSQYDFESLCDTSLKVCIEDERYELRLNKMERIDHLKKYSEYYVPIETDTNNIKYDIQFLKEFNAKLAEFVDEYCDHFDFESWINSNTKLFVDNDAFHIDVNNKLDEWNNLGYEKVSFNATNPQEIDLYEDKDPEIVVSNVEYRTFWTWYFGIHVSNDYKVVGNMAPVIRKIPLIFSDYLSTHPKFEISFCDFIAKNDSLNQIIHLMMEFDCDYKKASNFVKLCSSGLDMDFESFLEMEYNSSSDMKQWLKAISNNKIVSFSKFITLSQIEKDYYLSDFNGTIEEFILLSNDGWNLSKTTNELPTLNTFSSIEDKFLQRNKKNQDQLLLFKQQEEENKIEVEKKMVKRLSKPASHTKSKKQTSNLFDILNDDFDDIDCEIPSHIEFNCNDECYMRANDHRVNITTISIGPTPLNIAKQIHESINQFVKINKKKKGCNVIIPPRHYVENDDGYYVCFNGNKANVDYFVLVNHIAESINIPLKNWTSNQFEVKNQIKEMIEDEIVDSSLRSYITNFVQDYDDLDIDVENGVGCSLYFK